MLTASSQPEASGQQLQHISQQGSGLPALMAHVLELVGEGPGGSRWGWLGG